MKKTIILLMTALCSLSALAQTVPAYAPSNGLVGWWPFNGNAIDESINSNNGIVNGATLTTNRFGIANSSYSFDGVDDLIDINNITNTINDWSISFWFNSLNSSIFGIQNPLGIGPPMATYGGAGFSIYGGVAPGQCPIFNSIPNKMLICDNTQTCGNLIFADTWLNNIWYNITILKVNTTYSIYVNGILNVTGTINNISPTELHFGNKAQLTFQYFSGKLDDIGIWDRALTQQEITNLYNSCTQTSKASQPTNQTILSGTNAVFTVSETTGALLQWQTNLGLGYQNLSNAGQYSGVNTQTLTISNVSASNTNQTFRCIVGTGSCSDTTDVVALSLSPLSIEELALLKNIEVYPNPTSSQVNFNTDAKFSSIQIINSVGQLVFTKEATTTIDASPLSHGIYFIKLYNEQGQLLKVAKFIKE